MNSMDLGEDGSKQREWAGPCLVYSGSTKESGGTGKEIVWGREVVIKDKEVTIQ